MNIIKRKSWALSENEATPEDVFLNRRQFMGGVAGGAVALSGGLGFAGHALAEGDPSAGLYPVERNTAFTLDRDVTAEKVSSQYNNFYEFGFHKNIASAAQALPIRPWSIVVDGLVAKPQTIDIDALLKEMPLEERLYRHRCVEGWSMAVPWSGFQLSELLKKVEPTADAKYVRFETFNNPEVAVGQESQPFYPWPYIEGMTVEEAMNELSFMVTGVYGKPLAKQFGAPLRLALPWKYGFKSIKSIVRISLVDERPVGLWEQLQPSEYGFWANVNPGVPHPRWSQANELLIGTRERRATLMFNGYGEQVADLYKNLGDEKLFM
ncbi:MAG: protein-methionine-sulfoxide reductase catalytic subunit MsrP [Rhodobacteraceae bacterium]|nr:protein-methionine-sulfoxide reductase catalytic subunit MsrP [Paracoccaceae bacterium]